MLKDTTVSTTDSDCWQALYTILPGLVTHAVYTLRISLWYGQEYDIVEDVVQETLLRLLERMRKAERGEASPIAQIERMAAVTAYNCCRDMRRHDRRVFHFPASIAEFEDRYLEGPSEMDCSEEAIEQVFLDALFGILAREVSDFPRKQRQALLTELASSMCFEERPSQLQKAFLAAGINLQEYQQVLPGTSKARSQHTALLYWAYKRMTKLPAVQEYIAC
jgi:DNA-directed RNA polymerase specialized sigma24 family protein